MQTYDRRPIKSHEKKHVPANSNVVATPPESSHQSLEWFGEVFGAASWLGLFGVFKLFVWVLLEPQNVVEKFGSFRLENPSENFQICLETFQVWWTGSCDASRKVSGHLMSLIFSRFFLALSDNINFAPPSGIGLHTNSTSKRNFKIHSMNLFWKLRKVDSFDVAPNWKWSSDNSRMYNLQIYKWIQCFQNLSTNKLFASLAFRDSHSSSSTTSCFRMLATATQVPVMTQTTMSSKRLAKKTQERKCKSRKHY
jgi:hypothetical protein